MATKTITALVDGVVQQIEVEDTTSEEQITIEDRLVELEDKPIIADGNMLVGNGTEDLVEITPEDVLSHINGASVMTMTSNEFENLESTNANTLYVLTDTDTDTDSREIYVQNNEPTDAPEGSIWVDTDDSEYNYANLNIGMSTLQEYIDDISESAQESALSAQESALSAQESALSAQESALSAQESVDSIKTTLNEELNATLNEAKEYTDSKYDALTSDSMLKANFVLDGTTLYITST